MVLSVILSLKCVGGEGGLKNLNCSGRYPQKYPSPPTQGAFVNGIAIFKG